MRLFHRRSSTTAPSFVGGIGIDGDQACVVVCTAPRGAEGAMLRFDREATVAELPHVVGEAEELIAYEGRGARIVWVETLVGAGALHEVIVVPPQVRPFHDVRLEACLAGTRWGNVEAIEAAGYRLGYMFDRDRCIVGVASADALAGSGWAAPAARRVTSAAVGLLELLRVVDPKACQPGGRPVMALLCEGTGLAVCIVENGEVRMLHQTSLIAYFRELSTPPPTEEQPDEAVELEFEFGGAYAMPSASATARAVARDRELASADVESDAYQASVMRVIQELLALYREQYGAAAPFPQSVLVTGEAATRHAVRAFLARFLGAQFEVDELDAALVVRIDDPEVARRFASMQSVYGGALASLAAGMRDDVLTFDLGSAPDPAAARTRGAARGRRRLLVLSPSALVALAVALLVAVLGIGIRFGFLARERSRLEERLHVETNRQAQLRALTEERKASEARLAHTRELLAALENLRGRQLLPPNLLASVRACLPDGTRLDELSLANGVVKIVGSSREKETGTELALALERERDSFADVVPQTDTKVVRTRDEETDEERPEVAYAFTITARYTQRASSPAEPLAGAAGDARKED